MVYNFTIISFKISKNGFFYHEIKKNGYFFNTKKNTILRLECIGINTIRYNVTNDTSFHHLQHMTQFVLSTKVSCDGTSPPT